MTENRFFTWVWRFNGVAIAITVTLILCIILWQLTRDLRRAYFPARTTQVINVVPEGNDAAALTPEVQQDTRLGAPQIGAASQGLYVVPQFLEQTYRNNGYSKESGGNRVNYLVVDTNAQASRWLFEGTARLITADERIDLRRTNAPPELLGHVLHVIDSDTNADGQLTRRDDGQLYFVPPDWSQAIPLNGTVRSVLTVRGISSDAFEVMFKSDATNGARLHRYALPDATPLFEMDLK